MNRIIISKSLVYSIVLWSSIVTVSGQVSQKIGGNPGSIDPKAVLELESTTKGFLLPRMTAVQVAAITNPTSGMIVFCTDCGVGSDGELRISYNGVWQTFKGNVTGNITGNAATVTTNANLTGPITSSGNTTSVASQTGTGSTFVMNTSPTLVTPVLGVATATSINNTSIPASKTLVVTTDKLNVLSATSSSELAGVISDETGTGSVVLSNSPTFSGSVTAPIYASTPQALTDAATISWNPTNGLNASVTLGGNRTLSFTTPPTVGSYGTLIVKQDGTGNRTITLPSSLTNKILGSASTATTIDLSTAANAQDILNFYYDGTNCYWNVGQGYGTEAAPVITNLATNVSGTLAVANGGSGAATLTGYIKGNGTSAMTANSTIPVADVTGAAPLASPTFTGTPTLPTGTIGVTQASGNNSTALATTAFVTAANTTNANLTGPITSSGNTTSVASQTGTGSTFVMNTSPTLVTPVLGVATATSINNTSIPASKTLVVTTDKLNVLSATSSSELAGVISDETGTGSVVLSNSPTFTGSVTAPIYASTPQALTDAATINWNPTSGLNASVTLGGNRTLSFTSLPAVGSYGTLIVTQDGSGNRTITLPTTANKVLGSASTTTIALSTAANAKDILNFYYDGTNCYWNIGQGYGTAAPAVITNLATNVSGILPVANGGTGAATLTGLVKGNGAGVMTAAVAGTDYVAPSGSITGNAATVTTNANLTGPITSSGNTTSVASQTGTGSTFVMNTSPTLVTPVLGVATATSINSTTIPASKTLVVTTDKLNVHAATSSTELAGVISDETGTGSVVLSASPTFTGTPAAPTATAGTSTTQLATTEFVTGAIATATIPDATTSAKGKIQLAGDLAGTSAAPTVPGLALKAPIASPTFTGTVTAPIYASTPQALTYGPTISWNPTSGLNASVTLTGNGTLSFTSTPAVGSYGTLIVTQDATGNRSITLPTIPSATNKVLGSTSTTTIALSTAANAKDILNFYYDGTNCYWNIGQGYGTAAAAVITNLATNVSGTLPVANGGSGSTTLTGYVKGNGTSAMTANATIPVADVTGAAPIASPTFTGTPAAPTAAAGTNTTQVATTEFVTGAIATATIPDATTTAKGKIQLAGDLSGTAALPVVAANAITTAKILDANVTDAKIATVSASKVTGNITGSAANVTGTVAVANGGTAATTATGALTNLGAAPIASPTFTGTVTSPIYASTPQALTDAATISWNPTSGLNASVTLGGNRTLSFASLPAVGSYGTLIVTQDATGNRTITLPTTANKVLGSASSTTIALSTAPNAKDILNFYYDGTNCYWNIGQGYGTAAAAVITNLATGVSGTLPVANGGSGTATLTGIVKGNGTGAMSAAVAGTDYVLPTGNISGTAANVTGTTNSTLTTLSALSLPYTQITGAPSMSGYLTSSTGVTTLSGGTTGLTPSAATSGAITLGGTLSLANGGTGQTSIAGVKGILGLTTTNVAIGASSGTTSQGTAAVGVGNGTGQTNQGSQSVAIGYVAGNSNQGANSVAIGSNAAQGGQGTQSVAIGIAANSSANNATALGGYASAPHTNATALGFQAVTTANNTIQLGADGVSVVGSTAITNVKTSGTLTAGTVTYPNTHNSSAGQVLTVNASGTASWAAASAGIPYTGATGAVNLGAYNLTVNELTIGKGNGSLSENTVVGKSAMANVTGNNNTSIGSQSMPSLQSGASNTAIGSAAGYSLTTGSNNILMGYNANMSGNPSNSIAIGTGIDVNTSNTIQIGNATSSVFKTFAKLTTGTVTYPNTHNSTAGQVLTTDASGVASWATPSGVSGSGTINYIPKFTSSSALGNSSVSDDGTGLRIGNPNGLAGVYTGLSSYDNTRLMVAGGREYESIKMTFPGDPYNNELSFNWYNSAWRIRTERSSGEITDLSFWKTTGAGVTTEKMRIDDAGYVNATGFKTQTGTSSQFLKANGTVDNSTYLSGTVSVANGGTGATSASAALSNLGGAPIASPTFTGTPSAPTAAAGTNTTQVATTAFVTSALSASGLPSQSGNNGKFLTTNGSTVSWATPSIPLSTVMDAFTLTLNSTHNGYIFYSQNAGSPSFPANLPNGFSCTIVNYSNFTFTSNSQTGMFWLNNTQTGANTFSILPGDTAIIYVVNIPGIGLRYYVK